MPTGHSVSTTTRVVIWGTFAAAMMTNLSWPQETMETSSPSVSFLLRSFRGACRWAGPKFLLRGSVHLFKPNVQSKSNQSIHYIIIALGICFHPLVHCPCSWCHRWVLKMKRWLRISRILRQTGRSFVLTCSPRWPQFHPCHTSFTCHSLFQHRDGQTKPGEKSSAARSRGEDGSEEKEAHGASENVQTTFER